MEQEEERKSAWLGRAEMVCPGGPQEFFHLHSAKSLSEWDPGEAGRGRIKVWCLWRVSCSMSKKRRGRDVVESLIHWKNSSLGRSDPQIPSGTKSSLSIGKNIQEQAAFPYPALNYSHLGRTNSSLLRCSSWTWTLKEHQQQLQDVEAPKFFQWSSAGPRVRSCT